MAENPFNQYKSKPEEPAYEEVGGSLECQECHEVVHEGRYFDELGIVSWQCTKGHISKIEMRYE